MDQAKRAAGQAVDLHGRDAVRRCADAAACSPGPPVARREAGLAVALDRVAAGLRRAASRACGAPSSSTHAARARRARAPPSRSRRSRRSASAAAIRMTRSASAELGRRREAVGEFLGDEVGRQRAVDESARCATIAARKAMLWRDAGDVEPVERVAQPRDRLVAVGAIGEQLGDHRVVDRCEISAPSIDAAVDARRRRRPAASSAPAGRSTAGNCASGPRHRPAPRSPSRSASTSSCANGSFSPAAMRIISSTRSSPVTISVTGCSTCSRVFISRK